MASQKSKRDESCSLIINSAKKLIWKHGFSGVTLQNILDEAKITKGKFFHYYKSKDELFLYLLNNSLIAREFVKFDEVLKNFSDKPPFQRLLILIDKIIDWHNNGLPDVMRLSILAIHYFDHKSSEIKNIKKILTRNIKILTILIEACQKDKSLPNVFDANIFASFIPSASIGGNTIGYLTDNNKLTSMNLLELRKILLELNKLSRKKI